jgi:Rib/alpha/Esp surface antigen-like repeat protein
MKKFNFRIKHRSLKKFVAFLLTVVILLTVLAANVEVGWAYNTSFGWDNVEEDLNEWPLDASLTTKTYTGIGTAGFSYNRFYWNDEGRIVLEIDFSIFPDAPDNESSAYRTFREKWDNAVLFMNSGLAAKVDVVESFFMMSYPLDTKTVLLNKANISGTDNNIFTLDVKDVFPKMPTGSDYMKSKLYLVLKGTVTREQLDEDYVLELRYTNNQNAVYDQRGSQGAQVLGSYTGYPSVPDSTVYDVTVNNDDVTLKTVAPFKTASMSGAIPNPILPPDMMRTVGQSVIYDNIRGKLHVYYKQAPNHYIRGDYANDGSFLSSKIGIRQVMDSRIYDALKPDANGVVGQMMMLSMNGESWSGNIPTNIKINEFSYTPVTAGVGTRSYMMVPQGFKTNIAEKAIAPAGVNLKNVYLHGHRKEADYVRFIYNVDKNKMDALFSEANSSTFSISTSYITDRPTETTQTEYRLEAADDIVIPKGARIVFEVPKSSRSVFKTGSGNNYERIIGNMETKRPVSEMNHFRVDPSDFGKAYTITPYVATDGGYVLTSETGLTIHAGEPVSLTMFDSASPETVKMTVLVGMTGTDYTLSKYKTNENKLYTMPNANVRSGIIINRSANTPHVNEFFTDSTNITGHSKYADALVSVRKAKAVAADEEVFKETYSSTNLESFTAEGGPADLEGYLFTLDMPTEIQLKKDMALRFSNAAPGYFRSAAATYRAQAKVTFDKNGGTGETIERIVPLNKKAYGEDNYIPNGFADKAEEYNILWLKANGEIAPDDAAQKYLSDYEGMPILDPASDAYTSRQFYDEEPVRAGYTFLGWSTKQADSMGAAAFGAMPELTDVSEWDDEETNYKFTEISPVDQSRTVYAVWEKDLSTLRIVLHDNNGGEDNKHTVELPLADISGGNTGQLTAYLGKPGNVLFEAGFEKDECYFVGWSDEEEVGGEAKVHHLYTNASKVKFEGGFIWLQLNEEPKEVVDHTNEWKQLAAPVNDNGIATVDLYAQYKPLVKMTATKAWYDFVLDEHDQEQSQREIYEAYLADPVNNPPPVASEDPHFPNSNVAMVLLRTTEGKTMDPTKYEIVQGFYEQGDDNPQPGEDPWQWAPQEGHDANGRKYSYLMTEFNALIDNHTEDNIIEHFNNYRTWASMYITMIGQSDLLSKYTAISFVDGDDVKPYMAVATSNQPAALSEQYVNSTVNYKFNLMNFAVDVLPPIINRIQTNHTQIVIDVPTDGATFLYVKLSDDESEDPVLFRKDDFGDWTVHPENPGADLSIIEDEDKLIITDETTPLDFTGRAGEKIFAVFTVNRHEHDNPELSKYAWRIIQPYNPLILEEIKQEPHIKDENGDITHGVISAKIPAGSYAGSDYTLGYMEAEDFEPILDENNNPITVKPDATEKLTFNVPIGKFNDTTPYIIRGKDPADTFKMTYFDGPDIDLTAPGIDATDITVQSGDLIEAAEGRVEIDDSDATLSYSVKKSGAETALPDGITFDYGVDAGSIIGKFSGKTADVLEADQEGVYTVTIKAEDVYGNVETQALTLTLTQKPKTNPVTSITQNANDDEGNVSLTIEGLKGAFIKFYSENDGAFTEINILEHDDSEITNNDGTITIIMSQADAKRFNNGKIYVTQKKPAELESDKVDFTEEEISRKDNQKTAAGGAVVIDNTPPTPLQMIQPEEGTRILKITNISADETLSDVEDIDKITLKIGDNAPFDLIRQYDNGSGEPTGKWMCNQGYEHDETEEEVTVITDPNTGATETRTVGVLKYVLPATDPDFAPNQNIKAIYYDYLNNASIPVTISVLKLPEPVAPYNLTATNNSQVHPTLTVIRGKADPGAKVFVEIDDQTYTVTVDELGDFTLKIPKQPKGTEITVTSKLNNYTAPATVIVKNAQADDYNPVVETLTIKNDTAYDLTENVEVRNYVEDPDCPGEPEFEDVTPPGGIDVSTPGTYTGKVKITYPDGSSETVNVPVVVVADGTVLPKIIDVTGDPTRKTPKGYVRVTMDAGEGTRLADGQVKKIYDVKKGSFFKKSHYPTVQVMDGYKKPVTWSIAAGTAINKAANIVSTAVKITSANTIDPNLPDETIVENEEELTPEEKENLRDKILSANKDKFPKGTKVEVGDNGDATIIYPDGSRYIIPGNKIVVERGKHGFNTGDSGGLYKWLILMIVSAGGLLGGVLLIIFKRRSYRRRSPRRRG